MTLTPFPPGDIQVPGLAWAAQVAGLGVGKEVGLIWALSLLREKREVPPGCQCLLAPRPEQLTQPVCGSLASELTEF